MAEYSDPTRCAMPCGTCPCMCCRCCSWRPCCSSGHRLIIFLCNMFDWVFSGFFLYFGAINAAPGLYACDDDNYRLDDGWPDPCADVGPIEWTMYLLYVFLVAATFLTPIASYCGLTYPSKARWLWLSSWACVPIAIAASVLEIMVAIGLWAGTADVTFGLISVLFLPGILLTQALRFRFGRRVRLIPLDELMSADEATLNQLLLDEGQRDVEHDTKRLAADRVGDLLPA